jgi:hypothetical protein
MPEALPSSIDRVIACLDEELAEVERALDYAVDHHATFRHK